MPPNLVVALLTERYVALLAAKSRPFNLLLNVCVYWRQRASKHRFTGARSAALLLRPLRQIVSFRVNVDGLSNNSAYVMSPSSLLASTHEGAVGCKQRLIEHFNLPILGLRFHLGP